MIKLPRVRPASAPLALLLICLVVYVPMIYRLGFYWDDWPSIWFLHFWGPSGFQAGFASDRPLLAWVFMLTTPIFGESTIAWQYFSIFTRWLVSLAWWWTLSGLWPGRPRQVFWAAILLAVYPGFSQQYIAVTYSNAFMVFALFVLSIGSMIWAYRVRQSGDTKHRGDRQPGIQSSAVLFWLLMTFSLLASAFSMFITEYFFGLELLRPVLLYLVGNSRPGDDHEHHGDRRPDSTLAMRRFLEPLWKVLLRWSPYLLVMVPFLVWRLFFNSSPRAQILLFDELKAGLTGAGNLGRGVAPVLLDLAHTIGGDFIEVNFLAWFHDLNLAYLNDFDAGVIRLLMISVLLSVIGTALYLWLLHPPNDPLKAIFLTTQNKQTKDPEKTQRRSVSPLRFLIGEDQQLRWEYQAILLGVIAFLVSGWTIWITDLHIELLFPFDRFTMITMLGTSLLVAGLAGLADRFQVGALAKKNIAGRAGIPLASTILIAGLVGLSAAIQFQHRLNYRQEWLSQKTFFWQLLWRAPSLEPGTLVMTSEIPFTFYSDNSLTAPLNWLYNHAESGADMDGVDMPFLLYDIEARLGQGLPAIEEDQDIRLAYRTTRFDGSTSKAIVLFYDPPRCVKVMNPELDRFLPVKPLYIREAAPLSRLDLILEEPDPLGRPPSRPFPLSEIFGPEPPHTWCYYFEKAELYGQMGDWAQAAEMADQALKITKHFTEKNVSELIPFAMAYAHTGKWEKAVELSQNAFQIWDKTRYPFCDAWQNLSQATPDSQAKQAALEEIEQSLQCNFQ